MRKILIAAVVAVVLFGVGAFAAAFIVNSEDIASGTDDVVACAEEVDVDFTTDYNTTTEDWDVTGAVLTFYDNPDNDVSCDGFDATVVVETTIDGTVDGEAATESAVVAGGEATVTFDPALNASEVTGASVLVDGEVLRANNV
jgi:hypothetical protein